ncbi:hypothetical protein [Methylobacterium sp. 1030]|uniref:hypothetical protein n=1 Tax=Methylobacterium sp. 1030 TaxID=3156404 RepID=UPI003398015F
MRFDTYGPFQVATVDRQVKASQPEFWSAVDWEAMRWKYKSGELNEQSAATPS